MTQDSTAAQLTDRGLKKLTQPKPAPVAIFDTDVKQLQVRASAGGTVSFSVLKRPPGSRTLARFPVGTYPLITLAEARTKARDILREIEGGVDPRVRKAEEDRQAAATQASTFAAVAEAFIARYVRKKRSARRIEQLIRREFVPRWADRPIASIRRADVVALIEEIVDRGHPEAAHTALVYIKRLFSWAIVRGKYGLEHSPADHIGATDLIGAKAVRKRVLDVRELPLIWRAAVEVPFVRLLLLLGVRRSELGDAMRDEFDLDAATWAIPAARMKMNEDVTIPLPPLAVKILRSLPRASNARLFPVMSYSRVKDFIDAQIKRLNGGKALPRWTLHDLRRTFRTGLSTIGIAPHIAELCIAHAQQGMRKVYDQHRYNAEKRKAFAAWEGQLMGIVDPPADNVTPLRRAR